jgi:hypothetical protein
MYCSHLLSAASVFNCRWLYYTQEDANGMYGGLGRGREHRARYTVERDRETHDEVKYIAFRPQRDPEMHTAMPLVQI